MNWIDLLLIIIVLISIWTGWRKGLILGILRLVTWVGSIIAGSQSQHASICLWKARNRNTGWWKIWTDDYTKFLELTFFVILLMGIFIDSSGYFLVVKAAYRFYVGILSTAYSLLF